MAFAIGKIYPDFKSVANNVSQYESETKQNLWLNDAKKLECKKYKDRGIKPELVYGELRYSCSLGGRKKQMTQKVDCPFLLRLKPSKDLQNLVVSKYVGTHNHEINPDKYKIKPQKDNDLNITVSSVSIKSVSDSVIKCINSNAGEKQTRINLLQDLIKRWEKNENVMLVSVLGSTSNDTINNNINIEDNNNAVDLTMHHVDNVVVSIEQDTVVPPPIQQDTVVELPILIQQDTVVAAPLPMLIEQDTVVPTVVEPIPPVPVVSPHSDLRGVKFPIKRKAVGRPKGGCTNVIGLPLTKRARTKQYAAVEFQCKSIRIRQYMVLQMCIKPQFLKKTELFEETDILNFNDMPSQILCDKIDINLIKTLFTPGAFAYLQGEYVHREEIGWLCKVCNFDLEQYDSVGCEDCLVWYHLKCIRLKSFPKTTVWFCKDCKSKK